MKTVAILMLALTSCAGLPSQEMQQRQVAIEKHEDVRIQHNPEKIKSEIKAQLVGKWQLIDIEVEKGNVNAQFPQASKKMPTALPPTDASTQASALPASAPHLDANAQTSAGNQVRLPSITVEEHKDNQKIAAAKTALVASTRKNLTVEFFEEHTSYYYNGNNGNMNVTGQYNITTSRLGDEPFPFIRFDRHTGQGMLEFLFGADAIKHARAKRIRAALEAKHQLGVPVVSARLIQHLEAHGALSTAQKDALLSKDLSVGITVTDDRLYLILYGDIELTPKGWIRTGGLRCSFNRIDKNHAHE